MKLQYLLDTNMCIYIIKEKPNSVLVRFKKISIGETAMSTITYGELLYGAHKSQYRDKAIQKLEELVHFIPSLPLPADVADYYGKIRSLLEKKGTPIGNNDLWIAAHALCLDVTLVRNNEKEFRRIAGLKLENWC
ncbi:MAG: plasmid maintenance protein [Coxiella sp. RIFCSPHIGHO2_12_FULL_44_14]|nr:MAG: plasmid maintenance protein [Coxiella sp. RIFCSPHIGHO2_12_FULL_44_14]